MGTWFSLLILTIMSASAYGSCSDQAEEVRRCFHSWQNYWAPILHTKPAILSRQLSLTAGEYVQAAKQLNKSMYESSLVIRACVEIGERFAKTCDHDRSTSSPVEADLLPISRQMIEYHEVAKASTQALVNMANDRSKTPYYALTCHFEELNKGGFQLCFVVDRSSSEYEFVWKDDAAKLPITVGATDECTFFVDGRQRLVTADHCGARHLENASVFAPEWLKVQGTLVFHLEFSSTDFMRGPTMEDLALFRQIDGNAKPRGKALYYLALDRELEGGCEVRPLDIVACSLRALRETTGLRAEMVAFPGSYYAGSEGEFRRVAPQSVMRMRGDLIFDSNYERFFVQLYAQPGASGAPVYLSAGTRIGGMTLDRPLVLGPLSGMSGTMGRIRAGLTDNIGVVAALSYARLSRALTLSSPDQMSMFGGVTSTGP